MKLNKNKVLIGITGSIAAYKTVFLVRELVKAGYEVRVMLSKAGQEFVTPLTLQALSQNRVYTELFDLEAERSMGHIELAKWADLILIAPATANTIAKLANGYADDLISTVVMAKPESTPLLIAPAMNKEMYNKISLQANLQTLRTYGYQILDSNQGAQACGDVGFGRMLEPEQLQEIINKQLNNYTGNQSHPVGFTKESALELSVNERYKHIDVDIKAKVGKIDISEKEIENHLESIAKYLENFKGKKVLITAGPTREMIDPVRFISNHSSGKMGLYIAAIAQKFGANVTLVCGPICLEIPEGIRTIKVESAQQMYTAVMESLIDVDVFIGCAAVGDYRVKDLSTTKIKKANDQEELTLTLIQNPDILYSVSHSDLRPKYVVGFAAETNNVEEYAKNKVFTKGCDVICANDVSKENQGWNSDFNNIIMYKRDGSQVDLGYDKKSVIAKRLIIEIAKALYND